MFSSQSAARRGCWKQEGFLGQLADGRKCVLPSSFQSIRNRVFKPSPKTLEVPCPSVFLLSVGPPEPEPCLALSQVTAVWGTCQPACHPSCREHWREAQGSPPARLVGRDRPPPPVPPTAKASFSGGPVPAIW